MICLSCRKEFKPRWKKVGSTRYTICPNCEVLMVESNYLPKKRLMMRLDEAIKELTEPYNERQLIISPRFMEALKLGIEALYRLKSVRKSKLPYSTGLLPGETKE